MKVLSFIAVLLCAAVPASAALVEVTGDETWDGYNNPHAADGVVMTVLGTDNGAEIVQYLIPPEGMIIRNGAVVRFANTDTGAAFASQNVRLNGNNAASLTIEAGGSIIHSLNERFSNVQQTIQNFVSIDGGGDILQTANIDVAAGFPNAGAPMGSALTLFITGNGSIDLGTIDVQGRDSRGARLYIWSKGDVTIDDVRTGDFSAGGASGGRMEIYAGGTITLGDVTTEQARPERAPGNLTVASLASYITTEPPAEGFTATETGSTANTLDNAIVITGTVNMQTPGGVTPNDGQDNDHEGDLTLAAVDVDLSGATLNTLDGLHTPTDILIQAGIAQNGQTTGDLYSAGSGGFPALHDVAWSGGVVPTGCTDTDADGLCDEWEQFYFGDLDEVGSGDPDNDGTSNEDEETLGSDPTDPNSFVPVGGAFALLTLAGATILLGSRAVRRNS